MMKIIFGFLGRRILNAELLLLLLPERLEPPDLRSFLLRLDNLFGPLNILFSFASLCWPKIIKSSAERRAICNGFMLAVLEKLVRFLPARYVIYSDGTCSTMTDLHAVCVIYITYMTPNHWFSMIYWVKLIHCISIQAIEINYIVKSDIYR